MAISKRLENNINYYLFTAYKHDINRDGLILRDKDSLSIFLKMDLNYNNPIYYPICFNNYIIHTLMVNDDNDKYNDIVASIIVGGDLKECTVDTFMSYVLTKNINNGLYKALIKDKIYYGFRGLILDSNFNVLFALCHSAIINGNICRITGIDACISKETLLNNSNKDPVCKFILNKLIPHLITHQYNINLGVSNQYIEASNTEFTPNFVVKDLNIFIKRVIEPDISVFQNKVLNNIIIQNQDDLFRIS